MLRRLPTTAGQVSVDQRADLIAAAQPADAGPSGSSGSSGSSSPADRRAPAVTPGPAQNCRHRQTVPSLVASTNDEFSAMRGLRRRELLSCSARLGSAIGCADRRGEPGDKWEPALRQRTYRTSIAAWVLMSLFCPSAGCATRLSSTSQFPSVTSRARSLLLLAPVETCPFCRRGGTAKRGLRWNLAKQRSSVER